MPVSIKIRLIALLVFVFFPLAVSCQNESTSTASLPIPASLLSPEKSPDQQITEIPAKALLLTEQAFIRVAKQVTPSVVNISSVHFVRHPDLQSPEDRGFFQGFLKDFFQKAPRRQFRQKSLGSGFIISEEGFILTNHHVVAEADQITVRLSDRREFIGKVVGKDPERDLAMIKIVSRGGLPIAMLGDSRQIEVGAWAIAIGNPFGLDRTVTVGVISATGRNHLGLPEQGEFLQTDASINFGNSGGPLLNVAGEVIGINTAIIASGQGIGFAIPIDAVKEIIRDWIDNAPVKQG